MDVVLGLDCGTTSTKVVVAGPDGTVRSVSRAGYPLAVPLPGRAELDPAQVGAAVVTALRAAGAQVDRLGDRPLAVCLSSAMHGLVPLDAAGQALGPLLTWADGRAAASAEALTQQGRAAGLHRRTGTPVHPMSPLVKLVHLGGQDPAAVAAPDRWGGVKELLLALLCPGARVVDLSSASSSGLYDVHRRCWDPAALELAGLRPDQLADVVPTTYDAGPLRGGLGLPAGLPVIVGATDGPLANLGVGAVAPGVVAVSVGTSGALRMVRPGPGVDDAGRLFSYALTEDRWVLGGPVNNGGSVVRWAAQAFTDAADVDPDVTDARLLREASETPVGADGVICLPYLLGERAPWWRGDLTGAFLGLRRGTTRAHLVRAAVEGVGQQLALVRDSLPGDVAEVRATGGAVASPLWRQVLADTLDLPVRVADCPEGSGLGAGLLGWHALGALPDLDAAATLVRVGDPVTPDPAAVAHHRRLRPAIERTALALADLRLGDPAKADPPADGGPGGRPGS